jgi:arginine/lysine/ornithine decarboxylase
LDQARAPYLEALAEYAARDPGRFHVPGHKGGLGADAKLVETIGERALELDIPALIPGIDVPPPDPTPFQEAQRLAAEAWGARRSWFLIAGASQGNHAACLALRHAGRRVVMQRNVHSSAIDGAILAGLEPRFVAPEIDPELGVAHCLTPDALAAALDTVPDPVGAICVSPTYFGACADVEGLVAVAHSRGIPLVVDEAWGAHLHFSRALPPSALECGADLVVSSTHKIVGSLTQAAILHLGDTGMIDEDVVDRAVTLLESTSPSALLCASLDAARRLAATRGAELLDETLATLAAARDRIRAIPGLDVLDERIATRAGAVGWDPLRLSVDVRETGVTGHRFAAALREDDIHMELAAETVVVASFGMGGEAEALADRLVRGLEGAVARLGGGPADEAIPFAPPPPWGPLDVPLRDAFLGAQEAVPFDAAEGRVSAEALAAYPPGVPNVLPGERLTRETLDFIDETLAHGGHLRGAVDRTLQTIRVVIE